MGVHIEEWTKVKGKADEAKIFKKKKLHSGNLIKKLPTEYKNLQIITLLESKRETHGWLI